LLNQNTNNMKAATEKLFELLWTIQLEYRGIITTEDKSAIDTIILYRIKMIKEEEWEHAHGRMMEENR